MDDGSPPDTATGRAEAPRTYKWDYASHIALLKEWCAGRLSKEKFDALTPEEREQLLPGHAKPV